MGPPRGKPRGTKAGEAGGPNPAGNQGGKPSGNQGGETRGPTTTGNQSGKPRRGARLVKDQPRRGAKAGNLGERSDSKTTTARQGGETREPERWGKQEDQPRRGNLGESKHSGEARRENSRKGWGQTGRPTTARNQNGEPRGRQGGQTGGTTVGNQGGEPQDRRGGQRAREARTL